jgi:hypothetical protein
MIVTNCCDWTVSLGESARVGWTAMTIRNGPATMTRSLSGRRSSRVEEVKNLRRIMFQFVHKEKTTFGQRFCVHYDAATVQRACDFYAARSLLGKCRAEATTAHGSAGTFNYWRQKFRDDLKWREPLSDTMMSHCLFSDDQIFTILDEEFWNQSLKLKSISFCTSVIKFWQMNDRKY